mmetsp:Transcript_8649/g.21087  ORF Transcript_8649/g.21087 Transcript_8649/m.21087 type:complete len:292 (+) Transcript_8649:174-1049(+)
MAAETDTRPLVKDLLEQHASELVELRVILEKEDSYSKEHYDDIWMLRFLLSHEKVSVAGDAATRTMKFRQERKLNELGDVRHRLVNHMDAADLSDRYFDIHKKTVRIFKTETALMYAQPDPDRGLIQIISPGQIDMTDSVENLSEEDVFEDILMTSEIMYQILDKVTRRTGKLTKLLRIIDVEDFTLRSLNAECIRRDAATNKQLEDFYPQMLGTVIVSGMGTLTTTLWKVFKSLPTKRFVEKLAFVKPGKKSKDATYFLRYISKDTLCERYGGGDSHWPVVPPVHLWNNH